MHTIVEVSMPIFLFFPIISIFLDKRHIQNSFWLMRGRYGWWWKTIEQYLWTIPQESLIILSEIIDDWVVKKCIFPGLLHKCGTYALYCVGLVHCASCPWKKSWWLISCVVYRFGY
jgi:hypothetical protein